MHRSPDLEIVCIAQGGAYRLAANGYYGNIYTKGDYPIVSSTLLCRIFGNARKACFLRHV